MEISFLEGQVGDLNDFDFCKGQWGLPMAKIIAKRLSQVKAVSNLQELLRPGFPGKWHELTGDRKGQFSANLVGPLRLICVPDGNPSEYMDGNSIKTEKVVEIVVVEIFDYHD